MLIILLFFALFRTLHSNPLVLPVDGLDEFPGLDPRGTEVHFGQRGVNDIVVSCFATIFACTWTAVHPNIPATTDCWWTRFKRQVGAMIFAVLAPEAMAAWALRQRLAARQIADDYNVQMGSEKKHAGSRKTSFILDTSRRIFQDDSLPPARKEGEAIQWTLAHGFLVQMGGFILSERGRPIELQDQSDLIANIKKGIIDPPSITEEDIEDRSKGDSISKTLIIFQTTWFIVQCIARWSIRLPVTELEVATLGFAILNGITYGLWWRKPQNVGRPVFLEIKKPRGRSREIHNDKVEAHPESIPAQDNRAVDDEKTASELAVKHAADSRKEGWLLRTLRQDIDAHPHFTPWKLLRLVPPRLFQALLRPLTKVLEPEYVPSHLRVSMFYSAGTTHTPNVMAVTLPVIGIVFGSVHLIPSWFLDFPSRQEMWLWRVSAIIITVEPFLGFVAYVPFARLDLVARIFAQAMVAGLPLYVFSRIILLIISLTSLRLLPPAAFQTIEWTSFIPHV